MNTDLKHQLVGMREMQRASRDVTVLDVQKLLAQTAQSYPQIPEDVRVIIEVAAGAGSVSAVAREVADILRNLFVNAVQATSSGGTITLRARNTGNFVEIQVADTGIGIPKGSLERIFELFFSSKGSSGFGLWSARQYARANRGRLTVKSLAGQGTTFTLTLPRV
jgi:signal transduction histidine kinase